MCVGGGGGGGGSIHLLLRPLSLEPRLTPSRLLVILTLVAHGKGVAFYINGGGTTAPLEAMLDPAGDKTVN